MEPPPGHGRVVPTPSSDEGTPQNPEPSGGEGTPQPPTPSRGEGTPQLPTLSSSKETPQLPTPSNEEDTPQFPAPSRGEGTPQLPTPSGNEETPQFPTPSSSKETPQFLTPSRGEGTPRFPTPSNEEDTPQFPAPSRGEGTPQLPTPSGNEGTPQLPTLSSDEGTPQFPTPSRSERTPQLPTLSGNEGTPQLAEDGAEMPTGGTSGREVGAAGLPADPPQTRLCGREAGSDFYSVKWITWKGERTPVVTQSENGPCPLLAIMNVLFLQWKVKLPPQKEVVTAEELMAHLGDCILATQPREPSEGLQLNFQQNVHDTMMVLPKLSTGLDVNVRFTGVSDFEYTPECIVFDLLNVPLYHGWLVDPQSPEVVRAVGKLSYNQLVEKIITCKHASDSSLVSEGLVAEQFLETTASQLTYHGLCELTGAVKEGELSVFFRNNHFSTMIKHKGHLYLLVTDQGFLQEERVVWESLHSVDGDSCFCDTEFHLSHALGKDGGTTAPPEPGLQHSQVDQDYLVALALQQQQRGDPLALSDLQLARRLQQQEYQQPAPAPAPAQGRPQPGTRLPGERRQRQRPDLDCTLL